MRDWLSIFGIAVIVGLALTFIPLGLIWALNTLFGMSIVFGLKTWFAAFLLLAFFQSHSPKSK